MLLEEVVATGSEVDRAILYLNEIGANIVKIISIYNLEVGKPLLINPNHITSLCKPKEELRYVYRSK